MVLGLIVAVANDDAATFLTPARTSAGELTPLNHDNPALPIDAPTKFTVMTTFDRCGLATCDADYRVALARGDRLTLAIEGPLATSLYARDIDPWYDPTYGWAPVDLDAPAPYSAWYRLVLSRHRDAAGVPVVTWTRRRG